MQQWIGYLPEMKSVRQNKNLDISIWHLLFLFAVDWLRFLNFSWQLALGRIAWAIFERKNCQQPFLTSFTEPSQWQGGTGEVGCIAIPWVNQSIHLDLLQLGGVVKQMIQGCNLTWSGGLQHYFFLSLLVSTWGDSLPSCIQCPIVHSHNTRWNLVTKIKSLMLPFTGYYPFNF